MTFAKIMATFNMQPNCQIILSTTTFKNANNKKMLTIMLQS